MRETGGQSVPHKGRLPSALYTLVGISITLLTYKFVAYPVFITDNSLNNGPRLAICFRFLEPNEGDLVSLSAPINTYQLMGVSKGQRFVKRLYAKDPYVEYKGNRVVVNGTPLERDLQKWKKKFKLYLDNFKGAMNGYFVIGDVVNSIDSRYFGTVKEVDKCIGII